MNTEEEGRRDVVGSSAQPETVSATDEVFYSNEDQQQDFAKRRASRTSKTVLPHSRLPPINAANRNSINESSIRRKSAFLETPGTSLSEYSTSSPLLSAIQRDEDGDADESQSSLDEKPTFQRKRASSAQISNSVLPPILPHVSTVSERSSTSPTTGNGGGVGSQPKPSRRASIIDGRRLSSAIRRIFSVPPLTSAVPVVDEKGFLREIGMRKILIWSQLDVRLFDRVLEFKSKNADTSKELAFITFGSLNSSSDAVINMIYDDYTPDYILKYDVRSIHQNTRDAFERELLRLGFFIELETSKDIEFHLYVKIVAPFRVLCAAAEVYNLRRPLREPAVLIPISMIDQINKKSRFLQFLNFVDERIDLNLQTATFKAEELKSFRGTEDNIPDHKIMQTFFKPFYRALLTRYLLESIQVKLNEGMSLFEVQTYGIEYLVSQSIYLQYYYPHEKLLSKGTNPQEVSTLRDRVYKSWVRENSFGENLKDLRDYFGEKLALYFAFCIFYRNWLNVCAIAGLVVFAYGGWDYSQSSGSSEDRAWRRLYDNKLSVWFALAISFWSTFLLEFWKRRNNYLSYVWLTYTFEAEERVRHEFQTTETTISLISGILEPSFPAAKRISRQIQSSLVIATFMMLVVCSVLGQILLTLYLQFTLSSVQSSVLSGLFGVILVQTLKILYKPVATALNDRENYRTETQHEDGLIIKVWMFDFVNVFSRLIYYAFVRPSVQQNGLFNDIRFKNSCTGNCTTDLFIQVIFLYLGDMILGRASEYGMLFVSRYQNLRSSHKKQRQVSPERNLEKVVIGKSRHELPEYYWDDKLPVSQGANADYMTKVAQFGLLTCFSTVFPLSPLLALLNNTFEIHADAYKYVVLNQRVKPLQAQDIGTWLGILQFQSIFAVSINAGVVCFLFTSFRENFLDPYWSSDSALLTARFAFFVMWHVIVHGLCLGISWVVPDDPSLVEIAKRRQKYLERVSTTGKTLNTQKDV